MILNRGVITVPLGKVHLLALAIALLHAASLVLLVLDEVVLARLGAGAIICEIGRTRITVI